MSEYNALNERLKKQYEDVLIHASYRAPQTVKAAWNAINLFEKFTGKKDFTTFDLEQAKGFKKWLEKQKNKKGEPLSISTMRSTLSSLRKFFEWLAIHPKHIRKIEMSAAMALRLSNNDERASRAVKDTPSPTFEELRKVLLNMSDKTDLQKRDRAIIAFTALTGIRDDALVTMKIKNVDIDRREIWQNPKNVRTKKRKSILTQFMNFDPLWEKIFTDWYYYITKELGFTCEDALFPKQRVVNNPKNMSFEAAGLSRNHNANAQPVRDIFKREFEAVGLPYFNPHSLRNMLTLWAMEHCTQLQFKAISQNIGHKEAMTTYNSYGKLNPSKQRSAVTSIGQGNNDIKHIKTELLAAELALRVKE